MSLGESIFLFSAALVAGVINSVAGGGSFLSFPALLVSGISPIVANATNTAALWPGIVASGVAYRNAFTPEARRLVPALIVTGVIGGVLGARILLVTPQATFMRLVPWLLLAATLLFVASGRITRWVRARTSQGRGPRLLMAGGLLLELMIAIYIGYFGAGIGILLLALLALLGLENIHAMNGIKTILVGVCNGVARNFRMGQADRLAAGLADGRGRLDRRLWGRLLCAEDESAACPLAGDRGWASSIGLFLHSTLS